MLKIKGNINLFIILIEYIQENYISNKKINFSEEQVPKDFEKSPQKELKECSMEFPKLSLNCEDKTFVSETESKFFKYLFLSYDAIRITKSF